MITLNILAAVAQFERNLLIERTQSGAAGMGGRQEVWPAHHLQRRSARRGARSTGSRRVRVGASPPV
jgi:DNA invertase Pin-like site-specific DNA recombinase